MTQKNKVGLTNSDKKRLIRSMTDYDNIFDDLCAIRDLSSWDDDGEIGEEYYQLVKAFGKECRKKLLELVK